MNSRLQSITGVFFITLFGCIILLIAACGSSSGSSDGSSGELITQESISGGGAQTGSTILTDNDFNDAAFTNQITVTAPTSIQAAIDALPSGVKTKITLIGTFNQSAAIIGRSYIWLFSNSGAIIDGTGLALKAESDPNQTEYILFIKNSNYIKISGLTICNHKTTSNGSLTLTGIMIKGGCSNIDISGNTITGIENTAADGNAHGIAIYGNSSTPVSNILIDGNTIHSCKFGWSESIVLNGNVTDFTVSDNIVHDNDNIGIDFIGFESTCSVSSLDQARNGICIDNTVYNISSLVNPAYDGEQSADGIYVDGGKDIIIERNKIDACDIGIEVASEHHNKTTENITIRNNFISNSYQGNIMAGGYDSARGNSKNILIINNTLYNGNNGEIILQYHNTGVLITNNILYSGSGNSYTQQWGTGNDSIYLTGNMYYNGETGSTGDWNDVGAIFANPLFVNAASNDFHLQSGSPAKNTGDGSYGEVYSGTMDIDGNVRVNGIIDFGADEFY